MTTSNPQDQGNMSPYSRFQRERLLLRDELAIDRTLLSNERTLLAYLRAGVALVIAGTSIMHFADYWWFRVIGIICLPAGIVVSAIGIWRHRRMYSAITLARGRVHSDSPELETGDPQTPE